MVTLCLAGPEACCSINDGSDRVAYEMARKYLARRVANPLQAVAELVRNRNAAQRLVRSAWAQQRIRLLADALLRNGALTGEQILEISSM
jgi:hypothetical protein